MRDVCVVALLTGAALACVDMREGIPCGSDNDCVGYTCSNGTCTAPVEASGTPDDSFGSSGRLSTTTGGTVAIARKARIDLQPNMRLVGMDADATGGYFLFRKDVGAGVVQRSIQHWPSGGALSTLCSTDGGTGLGSSVEGWITSHPGGELRIRNRGTCEAQRTVTGLGSIQHFAVDEDHAFVNMVQGAVVTARVNLTTGVTEQQLANQSHQGAMTDWAWPEALAAGGGSVWPIMKVAGRDHDYRLWKTTASGTPIGWVQFHSYDDMGSNAGRPFRAAYAVGRVWLAFGTDKSDGGSVDIVELDVRGF